MYILHAVLYTFPVATTRRINVNESDPHNNVHYLGSSENRLRRI